MSSNMNLNRLETKNKKVLKAESIFQQQFRETFVQDNPKSLLELAKLMPIAFLTHLTQCFLNRFRNTTGVSRHFLPASFALLLDSLDQFAQITFPDKFSAPEQNGLFSNKIYGPLDDLSTKYQTIKQLYKDGFIELFPKKYKSKCPTVSEFLGECTTPTWSKIRYHLKWDSEENKKIERRITLLNSLIKILQIPNAEQRKFRENATLFLQNSRDEAAMVMENFKNAIDEDFQNFQKYNKSAYDNFYYLGRGKHMKDITYLKQKQELHLREMEDLHHIDLPSLGPSLLDFIDGNYEHMTRKPTEQIPLCDQESLQHTLEYLDIMREAKGHWNSMIHQ